MRGSRGGREGVRTPPPHLWNLQSLISPIHVLLEMKKIVIFHICALPQLYVKLLKVGPPPPGKRGGKKWLIVKIETPPLNKKSVCICTVTGGYTVIEQDTMYAVE